MKIRNLTFLLVPLTALTLAGCKPENSDAPGGSGSAVETGDPSSHAHEAGQDHPEGDHEGHDHAEGEGHGHPSEGPHGGSLVELGAEEYHAEVVHDEETGSVTFYILDGKVESPVAIDAGEMQVNLQHDGQGKQFTLAAKPQVQDTQGKSSRFVSAGAELGEELDHEHGSAQLVVTIAGKQYRGDIAHHHGHDAQDHDGDGHQGEDHKGHDHN